MESDLLCLFAGQLIGQPIRMQAVVVRNFGLKSKFLKSGSLHIATWMFGLNFRGLVGQNVDLETGWQFVGTPILIVQMKFVGGILLGSQSQDIFCRFLWMRLGFKDLLRLLPCAKFSSSNLFIEGKCQGDFATFCNTDNTDIFK